MKTYWFFKFVCAALIISLAACSDNDTVSPFEDEAVSDDIEISSAFEDVDSEVDNALMVSLGKAKGDENSCPVRTIDRENKIVTLDFGDENCEKNGRFFRGKIIISYTGEHGTVGFTKTITFENFHVNDNHIEGTRTITNNGLNDSGNFNQSVTLAGGKITFTDATTVEREASWTRTWVRGALDTIEDDEFHLNGTASGKNRANTTYTMNILETLIWKRACFINDDSRVANRRRKSIPVDGVKQLTTSNGVTRTVDFGDGECDRVVVITIDGSSNTVTVDN